MKIVFLDMDGVVNCERYFRKLNDENPDDTHGLREYEDMIDREAVERLNRILAATGAYVVLSSSWRHAHHHKAVEEMLRSRGFVGTVVDSTPRHVANEVREKLGDVPHANHRGHEIQAWLDATAAQVDSFVILDDGTDMVHLTSRLVHTSYDTGLLDEHVNLAVGLLAPATSSLPGDGEK